MSVKVLFVCLGNICRSPAAEGVFETMVSKAGLQDKIKVDSAGTGGWHVGEMADSRMRSAAKRRGFVLKSIGRQLTLADFKYFNYIIAMDNNNYEGCRSVQPLQGTAQLYQMRDYIHSKKITGIPDPYYGGEKGFEEVLDLLEEGCLNLLRRIQEENNIVGD